MFDFSRVQNYYIACGYTDMRKQIDGLVAVVELQFARKLDETLIFLFCERRADRIKALYWDGTGYTGVVVSDGYSGYNVLSTATWAGCWAHARRKWVEAMPDGATKENALAARGLEFCSRLFEVEQQMEGLPDDERREQRQLLSKPIIEEYYAWLETIFRPSGKLKKSIAYSLNQREYLCAFLDHGEIEISNNQVENAIRPIVVGRKNWLFCDTQAGANASVIVFSVLETAKANGLNPETYLNHLLSVLPERFAADPQAPVDDLMPWAERIQEMFRASDAEH